MENLLVFKCTFCCPTIFTECVHGSEYKAVYVKKSTTLIMILIKKIDYFILSGSMGGTFFFVSGTAIDLKLNFARTVSAVWREADPNRYS